MRKIKITENYSMAMKEASREDGEITAVSMTKHLMPSPEG
jgi:hypothetical protein